MSWDKDNKQPTYLPSSEKRNVIRTEKGWVRRTKKAVLANTSNIRVQDEILVTFDGTYQAASPKIVDAYFSNTTIANGTAASLTVVFSEPLAFEAGSGNVKIAIANTTGGAALTGVCAANNSLITNADNSLVFNFTATPAGTYGLAAQTLANSTATAISLKSTNSGTANASLVVSANVAALVSSLVVTA